MFKYLLIVLSLALATATAQATILFTPSISYMEQSLNDNGVESEVKMTMIDLRLGYVMESTGLYIGGLYSIHDNEVLTGASDSYMGPSIGWYYSGFLVVGTYYIYGERDITAGGTKYAEVDGFQIDLTYMVAITPSIAIGPQLTYHNVSFDEIQVAGVGSATDYSFTGISPYFNLTFMF